MRLKELGRVKCKGRSFEKGFGGEVEGADQKGTGKVGLEGGGKRGS